MHREYGYCEQRQFRTFKYIEDDLERRRNLRAAERLLRRACAKHVWCDFH